MVAPVGGVRFVHDDLAAQVRIGPLSMNEVLSQFSG
jgi:hypothetical protein